MIDYESMFCIVGGGATGIVTGKNLKQNGFDFTIVESSSDFGGNWAYDTDSSRMYKSVHLISSKKNTQLSDFPMPDHYPVYPGCKPFLEYLRSIAEAFDLEKHAEFNRSVVEISPTEGGKWDVTFCDGEVRRYGFVIVCNGLLGEPEMPDIPGSFSGLELHASKYRDPDLFRGKRVLVVGAGNSGCDIAVDAVASADKVFHSTRRGYHYMPKFINGLPTSEWLMKEVPNFDSEELFWDYVKRTFKVSGYDGVDYGLPEPDHGIGASHPIMNSLILYHYGHGDITAKSDLKLLNEHIVEFSDGTQEAVDIIIYATGYKVNLPFIDKSIVDWEKGLSHLFLNMIPSDYENLIFVGYVNSPAGFGNLSNMGANFMSAYFKAREKNTRSWKIFNELKNEWKNIDVGRDRYFNTKRHDHEVDLWMYLNLMSFVTTKLSEQDEVSKKGSSS